MRIISALFVGVTCLVALAGCGVHVSTSSNNYSWSNSDFKGVTNVIETAEIPSTLADLDLDNAIGNVRIAGTDSGPLRWTWKLTVRARTDAEAQQIAAAVNCQSNLVGGHLSLAVTVPNITGPHSIQSDFEIIVPKAASVRSKTRFGRTDIAQIGGDVDASGQNGGVEIHHVGGHVFAGTSFDRLFVSDTGLATLRNQNGEIQAVRIGGELNARTSFGALLAQDIGGSATLVNQNGDIKATGIRGTLGARTSFDPIVARDIRGAASLTNQNGQIDASDIGGPLEARTSFDQVTARGIAGRVFIRNQNGGVHVVQVRGDADIKTSFDRLSVEDIEGPAILANQNGDIEASEVTGVVKANTSFASLTIKGAGPEFICHNQNGAIRLRSTSGTTTNIEANTSFDNIELRLPAGSKPALVAHTTFGDVESDFPVLLKPAGQDAFAEVEPGALRATLKNQNGNIRVRRD